MLMLMNERLGAGSSFQRCFDDGFCYIKTACGFDQVDVSVAIVYNLGRMQFQNDDADIFAVLPV